MFALLLTFLATLARAADPVVVLPYTLDPVSGHLRVVAAIDGAPPASFVFDTGAPLAIVSRDTWQAAGHDPDKGFRKRAHGAGGSSVELRLATGASATVRDPSGGAQTLPLAVVAVGDVPQIPGGEPIAGILGIDLFKGKVAEVDLSNHRIVLHPKGADPVPGVAWQRLRRGRGRLLRAEVQLGDAQVDALVDLGSSTTLLNPLAGALPGVRTLAGCGAEARGLDGLPIPLTCAEAPLAFAGHRLTPQHLMVGPAGVMQVLRMDRKPGMVLGNDALRSGRLLIDLHGKRIAWTGPDPLAEALGRETCEAGCSE
jgi:hypothetical protein